MDYRARIKQALANLFGDNAPEPTEAEIAPFAAIVNDEVIRAVEIANLSARRGQSKGGKIVQAKLTPEERQAKAKKAIEARWGKV